MCIQVHRLPLHRNYHNPATLIKTVINTFQSQCIGELMTFCKDFGCQYTAAKYGHNFCMRLHFIFVKKYISSLISLLESCIKRWVAFDFG